MHINTDLLAAHRRLVPTGAPLPEPMAFALGEARAEVETYVYELSSDWVLYILVPEPGRFEFEWPGKGAVGWAPTLERAEAELASLMSE